MRLLIIEDTPQNLYMAQFLLEQAGHSVVGTSDNGAEGITLARELLPEMIVMDMTLPGEIDGFAATRILREDAATQSIKIVAFTALAMKGDRDRTINAGCDGYISKPIDPATFVQQLEAII
ncbi:MAG: response regulator [Mariprofundales bacterium]